MKKILIIILIPLSIWISYLITFRESLSLSYFYLLLGDDIYLGITLASILLWFFIFIYSTSKNKLPWLFLLILFPKIGFFLYLIFGNEFRESFRYYRRMKKVSQHYNSINRNFNHEKASLPLSDEAKTLIQLNEECCQSGVSYKSKSRVLTNGDEKFPVLIESIKKAQKFIFLEYYIFHSDVIGMTIIEELIKKAKEGVEVRILIDAVGSKHMSKKAIHAMKEAGILVHFYDKIYFPFLSNRINHRNHRKILVVDGLLAITGGINIGDEYNHQSKKFGFWRDTSLLIEGEAVHDFSILFIKDWLFATGEYLSDKKYYFYQSSDTDGAIQVIESGPETPMAPIKQAIFRMIVEAKSSIDIMTPYLILDFDIIMALKNATLAGRKVRIIVPGRPDNKFVYYGTQSYFEELLAAGVQIFTYKEVFCHGKIIIIDNTIATIGTTNMDIRSFYLNFEVNVVLYQTQSVQKLVEDFNKDLLSCKKISYNEWQKRSILTRLCQSIANIFSGIM